MRFLGVVLAAVWLTACAPQAKFSGVKGSQTSFRFSLKKKGLGTWVSGLNGVAGEAFEASDDYCYGIHVTGNSPELRRVAPPRNSCASGPQGLGLAKGLFKKGDTVEVEVPAGLARRFDLFAFPKTAMPDGACDGEFKLEPAPAGSSKVMAAFYKGAAFDAKAQLVASAIVDVELGENDITLIAAGDSAAGIPYACNDYPSVSVKDLTPGSPKKVAWRFKTVFPVGGLCSEVGKDVVVSVGDLSYTTTCDSENKWSQVLDLHTLNDGSLDILVQHKDLNGNLSPAVKLTVQKDVTASVKFSGAFQGNVKGGYPLQSGSITATAEDALGVIPADGVINLQAFSDSQCSTELSYLYSGNTLAVPSVGIAQAATQGVAVFSDINYLEPAQASNKNIYLQAKEPGGGITSLCVGPLVIQPPEGKFEFAGLPTFPTVAGTTVSGITVHHKSYFGVPMNLANEIDVGFYAYQAANCPGGSGLLLGQATISAGSSMGTYSAIGFNNVAHTFYKGSFMTSGPSVSADCTPMSVTADTGGPLKLIIDTANLQSSAVAGTSFAVPVKVADAFGNAVTAPVQADFQLRYFSSSASCSTGPNTGSASFVPSGGTVATVTDASINLAGTRYLKAFSNTGGISNSDCLSSINIAADAPDHYVVSTSSTTPASSNITVIVSLEDQFNNKVTNWDTQATSLSAFTDSGCSTAATGTFNVPTGVTVNATTHVATFSGVSYRKAETIYLLASIANAPSVAAGNCLQLDVTPGAATQLAVQLPGQISNPGAGTFITGTASLKTYASQPTTIWALDSYNNVNSSASGSLTITTADPDDTVPAASLSSGQSNFNLMHTHISGWQGLAHQIVVQKAGLTGVTVNYSVSDICAGSVQGSGFHGGAGTLADPYVICTSSQMSSIGSDTTKLDQNYLVAADLDLSVNSPWIPLGLDGSWNLVGPLTGTLDGMGHTLSNYSIAGTGQDYVGLFAKIGASGVVKNIKLAPGNITGHMKVGALAGYNDGTIDNVQVTIPSTKLLLSTGGSNDADYLGGLVGWMNAGIIRKSSVVAIAGKISFGGNTSAGGLVGYMLAGTIDMSSFNGQVLCEEYAASTSNNCGLHEHMGGLVGTAVGGTIKRSFALGNVVGNNYIGGLVGTLNGASLLDSYSKVYPLSKASTAFSIGTPGYVGGLVGDVGTGTPSLTGITRVYASGFNSDTNTSSTDPNLKKGALFGLVPSSWACGTNKCFAEKNSTAGIGNGAGSIGGSSAGNPSNSFSDYSFNLTPANFAAVGWDFTYNPDHTYATGTPWMFGASQTNPQFQWERNAQAAFDTASKASWVTVSNNGLTASQAQNGSQSSTTRAYLALGAGITYWEVRVNQSANSAVSIGVVQAFSSPGPLNFSGLGYGEPSGFGLFDTGRLYHYDSTPSLATSNLLTSYATAGSAYGTSFGPGDVIGLLMDNSTGVLKYFINGTPQGAANFGQSLSGLTLYPAVGNSQAGSYDVTLNAGTEPFRTLKAAIDAAAGGAGTWQSLNYLQ